MRYWRYPWPVRIWIGLQLLLLYVQCLSLSVFYTCDRGEMGLTLYTLVAISSPKISAGIIPEMMNTASFGQSWRQNAPLELCFCRPHSVCTHHMKQRVLFPELELHTPATMLHSVSFLLESYPWWMLIVSVFNVLLKVQVCTYHHYQVFGGRLRSDDMTPNSNFYYCAW